LSGALILFNSGQLKKGVLDWCLCPSKQKKWPDQSRSSHLSFSDQIDFPIRKHQETNCIRSYRRTSRNQRRTTRGSSATGSTNHELATTNCESGFDGSSYHRKCRHSHCRRSRRFRRCRSNRCQRRCCHIHYRNRSKEPGKSSLELARRSYVERRSCKYMELVRKLDELRKPSSFRKLDGKRIAELGKSEFRIPNEWCSKELA
jgi:hypothetical protein